jgi:hypothetical protein
LSRQRTIQIEGRIVPIKLHKWVNCILKTPMQCVYIVFTSGVPACQTEKGSSLRNPACAHPSWATKVSQAIYYQYTATGGATPF